MLPLLALALGLGAAKVATDGYTGVRSERYARRLRDRQEENEETQKRDARRATIMRALGVKNAPMNHELKSLPKPPDLSIPNILSGLLGFGSNAAAMGAAQAPPAAGPSNVPMPYQGQSYVSPYGPGSTIKPGTPYR